MDKNQSVSISDEDKNFSEMTEEQKISDEDVLETSKRLMEKNKHAYEVLAK